MRRSAYHVVITACALTALSITQPVAAQRRAPRALVQRALEALGGEAAARGVNTLSYDFVTVNYQLGQEETPLSPPRGTIQNGRIVLDFANARRYQDVEVRPGVAAAPPAPGSPPAAPTRQRRITLRDAGMIENNNQLTPEPAGQRTGLQQGMRFLPHRVLLLALDRADALTAIAPRSYRGDSLDGARYTSGADTAALYFDRIAGNLVIVETLADDAVLGDRRTATIYTRWTPTGGMLFPRQIDVEVNGRASGHTNIAAANSNEAATDAMFAIPDSILQRSRQPAQPPAPIAVSLVELGQGVWRAEGGTHHTLVVEQPTSLIIVEAPQSRVRMAAVFDTLRARFPNKPVQLAVNTHHHWDHSGGLRETMARGVAIVAHARNVDFVRGIATARKTVAPDNLSRLRRMPGVRGVRDSLTLGTGEGRIIVYPLPTAHAEGMLAAFVPSVGVLFTSDVVSPGAPNAPLPSLGSGELARFATQRGLTPRRYVGGHGRVAEWEEITRAARP
ncbi:MAG: MBL fold metallo-hydrolase [Gemmatimonadaceae bacterium]